MKLIKSLFVAITVTIMTAIAGSAVTHLFEETKDAQRSLNVAGLIFSNIAHAEESTDTGNDIQLDATNFTTSLNTYTPSLVIDENNFPTPQNNSSQSPDEKEEEHSVYIDILSGIVPVSGEDMDYEKILNLTDKEIRAKIENENMSIWDIAAETEEVALLENAYYAVYPARIIEALEQGLITQDIADLLIETANSDIENHQNTSIEMMIENIAHTDLN